MSEQRTILCVLSEEQRTEYQTELDGLRQSGIELVFQDDAEEGLEQAGKIDPQLVIVGMELGPMEGLEFLAFFLKRYPTYARTLVVLPSKDDPFPPMAHSRDPSTGRSAADEITFDKIAELAAGPVAAPAPAVAPAPSTKPVPEVLRPPPPITDDVSQKRGKGWLIPVIAVVAVAAIGGVALAVLSGDGDQPPTPKDKDVTVPNPPAKGKEPPAVAQAEPDAGAAQASPDTAPATKPAPKEPTEPTEPAAPALDLKKMTALPFSFGKASAQPNLTDEKRLEQMVKTLAASASRIEVGGHTSNEGAERYNHELGWSRAEAVRDQLVKRGIPKTRIGLRSYGGKVPTASNATEDERRKNRRVTVRLRESR